VREPLLELFSANVLPVLIFDFYFALDCASRKIFFMFNDKHDKRKLQDKSSITPKKFLRLFIVANQMLRL
jgi:hypothetical protein